MAAESTMLPLGTPAPDFDLTGTDGQRVTRAELSGRPLLVMFICNHCPYVRHIRERLAAVTASYIDRGVAVVGVNSNDPVAYPDDSPEAMAREVAEVGYPFPYLFDATQEVARAYRAACTPDFFLFGPDHRLVYRGQFDGSRPGNGVAVTGGDLSAAVDLLLETGAGPADQRPSIGCSIKWRPGNGPHGG